MASLNFSTNLIHSGIFDATYSVLPSCVSGKVKPFSGLIYSAFRRFKFIRHFAPIMENIKLFRKIPSQASVWYYNCTILNITLIILIKLFKPHVKQQMIILDYTPSKKLFDRFLLWNTNHMDGTIRLADSPLFTVKNSVCLPGVVPNDTKPYPEIIEITPDFLISGALSENISMLSMLLEAFAALPQLTLHITGKAPNPEIVKCYTEKYKNIIYHGMVDYKEYIKILCNTPFVLSTRNPAAPENQCNFPSKIIEALLHNRVIISTIHYPQLEGIKYFEVPTQIENFKKNITEIAFKKREELQCYSNQSDIVKKLFSTNVWKGYIEQIENDKFVNTMQMNNVRNK